MEMTALEVHKFLQGIIESDLEDGLLERLMQKPYIYTMCRNIIEHDNTYLRQSGRFADIIRLIPLEHNLKVLDVGAGVGFLSILLKKKFRCDVEAVDLEGSVSFWAERFEKYGILIKPCDIGRDSLPFLDNTFDIVVFSEVIEHLTASPKRALEEIKRVLKRGGYLVLTTPNLARASNIVKLILGRSLLPQVSESDWISSPSTPHLREYTVGELKQLVKQAGLENEKVYMSRCWDKLRTPGYASILTFSNNIVTLVLPRFRSCSMIRALKVG